MTGSVGVDLTVDITTVVGDFEVSASFTAKPGITALFGPSGSGKSVTLATIAGLLRPQRGQIMLGDRMLADAASGLHIRTQERHLGMVFQQAALLPHRSPLDNVALAVAAGSAGTRAERRAVARDWLVKVQAEHLADAPTRTLSGGEQQRVAVARALAGRAQLLLLDEPFSALDQPTRVALRGLIRELVDAHGLCAVLVTHDLTDIAHLADHVVVYEPGHTVASHDLRTVAARDLAELLGL
jgi:molybdate transport system ATP-binding protein